MNKNMISVIIPIYNTESYLCKCLDSVLTQTFYNLEVILIDDGSPDNCGQICDEYASKDTRIHVLHKCNQGLSSAWNDGVKMAKGEWITFVDSDDWLECTFFENMLEGLCNENVDLIVANGFFREIDGQQIVETSFASPFFSENREKKDYLKIKALNVVFDKKKQKNQKGLMSSWNKFYRTSFLRRNMFLFDTSIRAGLPCDGVFNFEVFEKASTVVGVSCIGYHYRVWSNSGTRKYDPNILEESYYVVQQLYKIFSEQDYSETVQDALSTFTFLLFISGLERGVFHYNSEKSYKSQIIYLKKMKKLPYYNNAIHAKNKYYLSKRQIILKCFLHLPWGFPIKLLYCMRQWLRSNV